DTGRFAGYRGVGRHITERKRAEIEHRSYVKFLESMNLVNRAIQGATTVDQMMSDVLDAVLSIFECDRAMLGRHSGKEDSTKAFTLLSERARPGYALDIEPEIKVAAEEGIRAMRGELRAAGGPVQWVLGSVPPAHARVLEVFGVQSVLS